MRFQVEFFPIDNPVGAGRDRHGPGAVFDVGQCGRGPQAHSKGGLGRRVGPHHVGTKNVLAQDDEIGTLVFDEVDTGVSGRAAQKVAEKMAQVARQQAGAVCHPTCLSWLLWRTLTLGKGNGRGPHLHQSGAAGPETAPGGAGAAIGGVAVTPALLESAEELLAQADAWRENIRNENRLPHDDIVGACWLYQGSQPSSSRWLSTSSAPSSSIAA